MAARCLLLLLPALALARIDVELSGRLDNNDKPNMKVYYSGNEVDIISDNERQTFGLTDNKLKSGAKVYFGSRPDNVFVRSPTPWGDLYHSYGWNQVLRTLTPKNAKILSINHQPQIMMRQSFQNSGSEPATFNVAISTPVQNTASSFWKKDGDLSVDQEINYDFEIDTKSGKAASLSYTSSWGEDKQREQTMTVGSEAPMELLLQPGQSVMSELHATKTTIKVQIDYEADLDGHVAVNYNQGYKGHHFWALDVKAVMSSSDLKNKAVSQEVIEINLFTNSKTVVRDESTNAKLMEVAY